MKNETNWVWLIRTAASLTEHQPNRASMVPVNLGLILRLQQVSPSSVCSAPAGSSSLWPSNAGPDRNQNQNQRLLLNDWSGFRRSVSGWKSHVADRDGPPWCHHQQADDAAANTLPAGLFRIKPSWRSLFLFRTEKSLIIWILSRQINIAVLHKLKTFH